MVKTMMKILPGLFLAAQLAVAAATAETGPGGRAAALGGAAVASPGLWSVSVNQAGLAWLKGLHSGLSAGNRFLLKELSSEFLAVAWSGKPGAFGVSLSYSGFSLYNEVRAGVCYAKKFGKSFSAGAELHYFRLAISEGYGSRGIISCDLGWMYRPGRSWAIGMQICNPVPVRLTRYPEEWLPVIFRLGASYCQEEKFMFLAEAEKDLEHPLILRAGAEVRLAKAFFARAGVHSGPFAVTGGIGLSFGRLSVDIATEYHMSLGFSPAVSMEYSFYRVTDGNMRRNHGRNAKVTGDAAFHGKQ